MRSAPCILATIDRRSTGTALGSVQVRREWWRRWPMRTHLLEFFTAPLGPPAVVAMRAVCGPRPPSPRDPFIQPACASVWRSRRHERFPLHAQSWAELEPEAAAQAAEKEAGCLPTVPFRVLTSYSAGTSYRASFRDVDAHPACRRSRNPLLRSWA